MCKYGNFSSPLFLHLDWIRKKIYIFVSSQRTRNTDQIKLHICTLNTPCSGCWFWRIITFPVKQSIDLLVRFISTDALWIIAEFFLLMALKKRHYIWNCAACEKCTFHWCWTNSVIRKGMNFKTYCKKQ